MSDRFLYSEDDYEIPGWTIKTRVLGTYVVSDTELDLDSGYQVDYDEEEETEDTSYEELNRLNPVTGGGDYYYTPVAEPANYSATGTVAENTSKTTEQDDLTQMRSVAVAEAVPEVVSTQTDAAARGSIPFVGIVVGLLVLAGAGGVGWVVYRKLTEE